MPNKLPKFLDNHKICIICEGNEEYEYLKRLKDLKVWNEQYAISLVNAGGNGNIPARYQDRYQNGADELVLVFGDTEKKPHELSPAAQEKARKYFEVKKWGSKITATANNKAIKDANKYHGYFALVSNKEKDPFECLRKYRKRETIESFFESEKQRADGTRARVWYTDTLRGRMFVQFISLCYYEYFSEEIRKLKAVLDS